MRPVIPQLTPIPALAPVERPGLDDVLVAVEVVVLGTVELVPLMDEKLGVLEIEEGDDEDVADEDVAGADVEIVAPYVPRVTISVFEGTRKRPMPESQHPSV